MDIAKHAAFCGVRLGSLKVIEPQLPNDDNRIGRQQGVFVAGYNPRDAAAVTIRSHLLPPAARHHLRGSAGGRHAPRSDARGRAGPILGGVRLDESSILGSSVPEQRGRNCSAKQSRGPGRPIHPALNAWRESCASTSTAWGVSRDIGLDVCAVEGGCCARSAPRRRGRPRNPCRPECRRDLEQNTRVRSVTHRAWLPRRRARSGMAVERTTRTRVRAVPCRVGDPAER